MTVVNWTDGRWRQALVYGLGLSGRAAARLLLARGVAVVAVDARPAERLELAELAGQGGFRLLAGAEPERLPPGVDAVVVSPGVPPTRPLLVAARAAGLPVLAEVELAFPLLRGPVAAITGTNGKSTTTALTGAILRAAGQPVEVCGNIGTPLCARVEGPPGRVFVVELSSFQLEALASFRAEAAAFLNLTPDHLDRYPDLAAYGAAKLAVFDRQGPADWAVLNADDPWLAGWLAGHGQTGRRRLFSHRRLVGDGCFLDGSTVLEVAPGRPPEPLFRLADLALEGRHNLENAMAAALLARRFGVAPEPLRRALREFPGLPHRMERVAERAGVVFFNDSKGTNVAATAKSLEGLRDGSVHLILGGRAKGDDPRDLLPLARRKVRRLYLIGEAAPSFAAALGELPGERCDTLARAVASAAGQARAGEVVLLSPACASYDQYSDYAQRGEHFRRLVATTGEAGHGQETGL